MTFYDEHTASQQIRPGLEMISLPQNEYLELLRQHAELEMMYERLAASSREIRQGIQYYGAKFSQRQKIVSHFPKHRAYIDLFFGTGGVFWQKEPAPIEVVNDLYGDLMVFFRVLRNQPDELVRTITLTPYHQGEYMACHDRAELSDLEIARRIYTRLQQSFSGSPIRKTGWRRQGKQPTGSLPGQFKSIAHLYAMANRLSDAYIECKDAFAQIVDYDAEDAFFYADPPYERSTRGAHQAEYAHEMTDEDHRRLAAALHGIKGMAIVSGYSSDLYTELYADWQCIQFPSIDLRGNTRIECLWVNPLAQQGMKKPQRKNRELELA